MVRIFIFDDVNTKHENMPPSTQSIKIILFYECGVHLAIPFCILQSSVVPSRRVGYFLEFSVNFRLIVCPNFDLELIYFALSMNTSSYSPIASGTYNRWKVEFVLKTNVTKNINTTQAMAELYTTRLGGSYFYTF